MNSAPPTSCSSFAKLPLHLAERTDLTASSKLVFAILANRLGPHETCWPGQRRIAKDCGLSKNTAHRAIKELERAGLLEVLRPSGPQKGVSKQTCEYRLIEQESYLNRGDPKTGTSPKWGHPRPNSGVPTVPISGTELEQGKQNKGKERRIRSSPTLDPWAAATAAMTSNSLQTSAFKRAWAEWCEYRRELRKPLTKATIKKQIALLEEIGHDKAIECVSRSITHGWTGLFDAKKNDAQPQPRRHETREDPDAKFAAFAARAAEARR